MKLSAGGFALEAEGEHSGESYDRADDRHIEIRNADLLADQHHCQQTRYPAARRAAYAFDGEQLFAFAEVVRQHGHAAVYRSVAESVHAVVNEIRYGEPCQLPGFGYACRYREKQDHRQRYRHDRHPQPGHEFVAAPELDLVEQRAEDGVVESIPHLDQHEHQRHFFRVHALQKSKCGEVGGDKRVDEVLPREIGIVADLFAAGHAVAGLSYSEYGLDKRQRAFSRPRRRAARRLSRCLRRASAGGQRVRAFFCRLRGTSVRSGAVVFRAVFRAGVSVNAGFSFFRICHKFPLCSDYNTIISR